MTKLISTLFLMLHVFLAQSQTTISGTIQADNGQTIEVANIILFSLPDTAYVDGTVTYDGHFSMQMEESNNKILQISSLGFEDYWLALKDLSNFNLGTIQISSSSVTLMEAVVKAKIPHFEQKNGVLNVNVENTSLSSSGTAVDVLKRTPGLFLTRDGEDVQMFGKGKVKIFLDGQEVQSMEIIKSLNSEEIVKIEVIRNPSAKYDAEGQGGVINIITKNTKLEGLLGNITANTSRGTYSRGYLQTDLSYKKGKWGLFGSVAWNPYKVYQEENYKRVITQPNSLFTLKNKIKTDELAWVNNDFSTKVSYALTKQQTIKVGFRGKARFENLTKDNKNKIYEGDNQIQDVTSTSDDENKLKYGISDIQYRYMDTTGRALTLSGNYTNYKTNNNSFVDEQLTGTDLLHRKSTADGRVQIWIGRVDYEQNLFNNFMKAEIGTKFSATNNTADTDFFTRKGNQVEWKSTGEVADAISYKEKEFAAYTDLSKEAGKWSFRAGLRFEQSIADANSSLSGNYYDTTYQNIFPSGMIEYKFTDDIVANLSLSKRIERPDYYDLNPFVTYLDSFSLLKGNPSLIPEIINEIEFNASYSGYPILTLGYSETQNPINIIVESDPNNPLVNIGVTSNLESEKKYHGQIVLPYKNKWWTSGNGFGYSRKYLKDDLFNDGKVFRKDEKFIFSYQDFNVKDWNFGAQYVWFGPGIDGIFEYSSGWFTNFWVGRKFLDGKLSVRLTGDDIFKSQRIKAHSTIGNLYVENLSYFDTRIFRITLKYKFGSLKSSVNLDGKKNGELNRIDL